MFAKEDDEVCFPPFSKKLDSVVDWSIGLLVVGGGVVFVGRGRMEDLIVPVVVIARFRFVVVE